MADETSITAAPVDGAAHPQPDGTVPTGDEPAWVWVQDDQTGHRYDVKSGRLPVDGLRVVDGYPLNFNIMARRPKTREAWETDPSEPPIAAVGRVTGQTGQTKTKNPGA